LLVGGGGPGWLRWLVWKVWVACASVAVVIGLLVFATLHFARVDPHSSKDYRPKGIPKGTNY